MTLSIGSIAPNFTAETTQGPINFHDYIDGGYGDPLLAPEGLHAGLHDRARLYGRARRRVRQAEHEGHRPVGRSGRRHEGWAQDIKDVTGNEVNFPMIGDHDLKVAKLYNMLPADAGETSEGRTAATNATVRTVYIVGPDKQIKAMLIYPMSTGRNFDEVLRLLDSIQLTAKHSVATPVNWKQGEDCIIVPSLNDEAAREKFPGGWKTVKPYLAHRAAAAGSACRGGASPGEIDYWAGVSFSRRPSVHPRADRPRRAGPGRPRGCARPCPIDRPCAPCRRRCRRG